METKLPALKLIILVSMALAGVVVLVVLVAVIIWALRLGQRSGRDTSSSDAGAGGYWLGGDAGAPPGHHSHQGHHGDSGGHHGGFDGGGHGGGDGGGGGGDGGGGGGDGGS